MVLEEPHHLELSEDALGADRALEHVGQLLERHPLAVARISHRPNHAKGAVADGTVGEVVGIAAITCCNEHIKV